MRLKQKVVLTAVLVVTACGGENNEPVENDVPGDVGVDATVQMDMGDAASEVPECGEGEVLDPTSEACIEGCVPWVEDSGCTDGQWCSPRAREPGLGDCISSGSVPDDESCLQDTDCAAGSICIPQWMGDDDLCRPICNPDAGPMGPGAICDADQFCGTLVLLDGNEPEAAVVGTCGASCDYDLGLECPDSAATCVPHELTLQDEDACLELPEPLLSENEDCAAAGKQPGQLCAADAICVDVSSIGGPAGLLCYEICRLSLGGNNTINHPDCTRTSATCLAVFETGTVFGLCGPDGT